MISLTKFSRAFSCTKIFGFWINYHWNMLQGAELIISQHWFKRWCHQAINQTSGAKLPYSNMMSLDLDGLNRCCCIVKNSGMWQLQWKSGHFETANSPVTGEFPAQRPVMRSFRFFYLRLKQRLGKQSWGWWFETPSRSLWRHCNGKCNLWKQEMWKLVKWK